MTDEQDAKYGAMMVRRFEDSLKKLQPRMSEQLASGIDLRHQIGAAVALAKANDKLLPPNCTLSSIVDCIVEANRLGLNLHPGLKHAYLVPFYSKSLKKYEAKLIIDYRGLIYKGVKSRIIKDADVTIIREGDRYRYGKKFIGGHNESYFEWEPAPDDERGEILYAAAEIILPDGTAKIRVMPRARIDVIRSRAPSSHKSSSPWVTDFEEMAAKSVLKWAFKLIPQKIEFAELLAVDNAIEGWDEEIYRTTSPDADDDAIDVESVEIVEEPEDFQATPEAGDVDSEWARDVDQI